MCKSKETRLPWKPSREVTVCDSFNIIPVSTPFERNLLYKKTMTWCPLHCFVVFLLLPFWNLMSYRYEWFKDSTVCDACFWLDERLSADRDHDPLWNIEKGFLPLRSREAIIKFFFPLHFAFEQVLKEASWLVKKIELRYEEMRGLKLLIRII